MKILFLSILLIILGSQTYAQKLGKTYTFDAHHFSIDFPEEPQYEIDSMQNHTWSVEVQDENHPNALYSITLSTFSPDYIHSDSASSAVEPFLDSSQKTFTENSDYEAFATTLAEINGFLGKVYRYKHTKTNVFIEGRVFLVENTLYQLYVVTRENKNHNIYMNPFFDSFQLTHQKKGKTIFAKPADIKILYEIQFSETPKTQVKVTESVQFGKLLLHISTLGMGIK